MVLKRYAKEGSWTTMDLIQTTKIPQNGLEMKIGSLKCGTLRGKKWKEI